MLSRLVRFFLEQRLVAVVLALLLVVAGLFVAPFDWDLPVLPRDPVPVDAIPDIGENQQIVFTEWPGRSPQDVEDQVTYPLTVALLGLPGVETIRSSSFFGYSSIYVLFDESVEFYWSRSRILEKLNSLPRGLLPDGVQPALGPDATALGQVFWYTLEGRDPEGDPAGGWDLDELRSIQDWYVRYALMAADGVAEVASVGGFVREYQVDVDPDAMRAHRVTLDQVFAAVRDSNLEVGARTIEVNRVEYVVRGLGWIEDLGDIEEAVITSVQGVPLRVKDVAHVTTGPALRRGALDKGGAEAVGGVVVVRTGANPLQVIENVRARIAEISPGLPGRTLRDGTLSKVTIVPFYDRTGLIHETLETLDHAISLEILVTVLVVVFLVRHLRSSLLIAALLPIAVLFAFVMMKLFGVDANIVALSGIAIAIGTMVDVGIVLCENIRRRLAEAPPDARRIDVVHAATVEVGGAVLTAVTTTVIAFLPVFTMVGAEGRLFRPLAATNIFGLVGAIVVALLVLPVFAAPLLRGKDMGRRSRVATWIVMAVLLTWLWEPVGAGAWLGNLVFVVLAVLGVLFAFGAFERAYPRVLGWCLAHKRVFLIAPAGLIVLGALAWRDLGREFMPPLDEGSYLFMPTTMPHASMGEALDVLAKLDRAIESVPEVASAVGKIGRVDSALDPAPISMVETLVQIHPEYADDGTRNWRDGIDSADDVWDEIVVAARLPGTTAAPRLQPIAARLVMLQSGMRAPMGVKVQGPDLETIDAVGRRVEELLKTAPGVEPATVVADRVVGKPYLEIDVDRPAAARYGVSVRAVQDVVEIALGGRRITTTVEGRERYPVRVRYMRELRGSTEEMERVLVPTPSGAQIPLAELASIDYVRGPQVIRTEDTFLTSYVVFDKQPGWAEVDVVESAQRVLGERLEVPAGASYAFAGTYENQVRAARTLTLVLPVSLVLIFLVLYLHFRATWVTLLVFAGVFVAWAGGFLLVWLYGTVNLSVAVWVGFLALFGIATDDGVVMGTYLRQVFDERRPTTVGGVREAVLVAGKRRVRPCLMTTATTLLALMVVLTSTGRGADIMVPMAIPAFGGMVVAVLSMLVVPVLYGAVQERRLTR